MTSKIIRIIIFLGIGLLCIASVPLQNENKTYILTINSAIGAASADYIHRGIEEAKQKKATLIILKLDTPGGLDKSMRMIIKDILESPIPFITYVSPNGARAASAGTYILYASHVAAMAPATNLGAATPVQIGMPKQIGPENITSKNNTSKPTMNKKMINDATAYIVGLAELHGRNKQWAEKAVKEAVSISANTALKKRVIDIVAISVEDLLNQVHGLTVNLQNKPHRLNTKNTSIIVLSQDWRTQLLTVITSPDVAYILLILGIYGIFFEFANPGFIVPGVVGAIALLLALYALQMLPINFAGLALMFLGIGFLALEAFTPSFGILGLGGTLAFAAGSFLLIDINLAGQDISWSLILFFTTLNTLFFLGLITLAVKAYKKPVVTGKEALIGVEAIALETIDKEGYVRLQSEIWHARSTKKLSKGQSCKVIGIEGLLLIIQPL